MMTRQEIVEWLLDSDPSIRWQVMRDVCSSSENEWQRERDRIGQEGWGKRILDLQGNDGLWNGSLYNGKWISTSYSLYLLKLLGLAPGHERALKGCRQLLTQGLHQGNEIRFSKKQDVSDWGVTALVLSICSYFGEDSALLDPLVANLIRHQEITGNWLPYDAPSAEGYTFETTLLVLEALLQVQFRLTAPGRDLLAVVQKGHAFLLENRIGCPSGLPIKRQWLSFSYPNYWFYDLMSALDYFAAVRHPHDSFFEEAIDILNSKR
ncbi:MAG: hypothetical protein EHM79_20580, partial [Geobacter sp.]